MTPYAHVAAFNAPPLTAAATERQLMAWARFDDGLDESLVDLSIKGRWLFVAAITYSRRRNLGGRLNNSELVHLLRGQGVSKKTVDELADGVRWSRDADGVTILGYDEFNPLTSTERVKRHRERSNGGPGNADETFHETQTKRPHAGASDAPASRPRAGSPEPVPVPNTDIALSNERAHPTRSGPGVDSLAVEQVLDAYVAATDRGSSWKRTTKRRDLVRRRLREGYSVADLVAACWGWRRIAFNRGENDDGRVWNELELVLRDAAHVERFRDAQEVHGREPDIDGMTENQRRLARESAEWLQSHGEMPGEQPALSSRPRLLS